MLEHQKELGRRQHTIDVALKEYLRFGPRSAQKLEQVQVASPPLTRVHVTFMKQASMASV